MDVDDMTPMPRFNSRGQTYRAVLGDTLVLPCEIQNVGEYAKKFPKYTEKYPRAHALFMQDNEQTIQSAAIYTKKKRQRKRRCCFSVLNAQETAIHLIIYRPLSLLLLFIWFIARERENSVCRANDLVIYIPGMK